MMKHSLQMATDIALEAGQKLRARFLAGQTAGMQKGNFDVLTAADVEAAQAIDRRIRENFPGDSVSCEESGRTNGSSRRLWHIDPMDGTKNFSHGLAHFCTMLALEEDGVLQLAVIHDPMRSETFSAIRGHGAWLNGSLIHVSAPATIGLALVVSGFPSSKRHQGIDPAPFHRVCAAVQGLRRTGSTGLDLAYVASGRYDGLWDWGLEQWDLAPGLLIVEEAGGVCSDWSGNPYRLGEPALIAASPWLQAELKNCLTEPSR